MYRGQGKDYLETLKLYKRFAIKTFGLGWFLATPKVKMVLLESINDLINDLTKVVL